MALRDGNRIPGAVHDLTAILALSDVADRVVFVSPRTLALLANLAEVDVKIYSRYIRSYLAGGMVNVVEDDDTEATSIDTLANRFGVEVVPVTTVRDVVSATMYKTGAGQALTTGVLTKIVFGAVDNDPLGICDLTSEQIVIPRTGRYQITGRLLWVSNATGYREINIIINGVQIGKVTHPAVSGATHGQEITVSAYLQSGDVVQLYGRQTSGGNLQIEHVTTGLYWNMLGVTGF